MCSSEFMECFFLTLIWSLVRPKMIVIPNVRTLYQIAGGDTTMVQVVIVGGNPTPEVRFPTMLHKYLILKLN